MKICIVCKSKMPDELFVSDTCPICAMTLRNIQLGIDPMTPFTGDTAAAMVEEAWQYYKPKGKNIYGLL